MTSPVDIRPDQLEIVQEILLKHLPAGVKVWVFGSRANWTTKDSSDLDLALEGESKLSHKVLGALKDAFEDSALPYTVDVLDLNRIGDSFRKIVESQKVLLPVDGDGTTAGDWIQCTVAEACGSINYGLTASASSRSDGPKFLRITDIVSGSIDWNTVPHVEADDDTVAKYRLHDGDIVIARTGASTGTSAYVSDPPPSVFASYLVRLQAKPEFDARFLAYYLKSKEFWDFIHGVLGDKSAQPNASASTMTAAPFRAPRDEAQQRAIAHILGTLDDKIELNRRMNETLEEMARALFKCWFVDFEPVRAKMEGRWRRGESLPGMPAELYDVFPEGMVDSELGEIPDGWGVTALGDVATESRISVKPSGIEIGTPLIALEHMPRRCIALSDWDVADGVGSNKFRFERCDILFGKLRPYFHKVGIAPLDGVCSTDIVVVAPAADCWFGFVLGHISSTAFVEYTDSTSTGTRMPRTKWSDMARYAIALPGRELAEAFTFQIQNWTDSIVSGIHESRAIAALRDMLLPKLIGGKLQVTQRRYRQHD